MNKKDELSVLMRTAVTLNQETKKEAGKIAYDDAVEYARRLSEVQIPYNACAYMLQIDVVNNQQCTAVAHSQNSSFDNLFRFASAAKMVYINLALGGAAKCPPSMCLEHIAAGKCTDAFVIEHIGKKFFADKYQNTK